MADTTTNTPSGTIIPSDVQQASTGWRSPSGQTTFMLDLGTHAARSLEDSNDNVFIVQSTKEPDASTPRNRVVITGLGENNTLVLPGQKSDYKIIINPDPIDTDRSYKMGDLVLQRTNSDGHVTTIALHGRMDKIGFAENTNDPAQLNKAVADALPVSTLSKEAWDSLSLAQQCQARAVAATTDIQQQFRSGQHTDIGRNEVNAQILAKAATGCVPQR